MKKALLSILLFSIVGIVSYLLYIEYKTKNEWLFQFTEDKSAECTVYSHRINGVVYSTTMAIYDIQNNNKYEKFEIFPTIDISRTDIIKNKTISVFIDNNESQEEASYPVSPGSIQIITDNDLLNKSLYTGKKVTLKMIQTNGEDFIVSFQGNEQFAAQVDKCRKILALKLKEYTESKEK